MPKPVKAVRVDYDSETKGKTPYQGKCRAYGEFKCIDCNHCWSSAYSWANCGQMCTSCNVNVYPFRQLPLKNKGKKSTEPNKNHLRDLCEKCRSVGGFCGARVEGRRRGRRLRNRGRNQA